MLVRMQALGSAIVLAAVMAPVAWSADRPNMVLVMADDPHDAVTGRTRFRGHPRRV